MTHKVFHSAYVILRGIFERISPVNLLLIFLPSPYSKKVTSDCVSASIFPLRRRIIGHDKNMVTSENRGCTSQPPRAFSQLGLDFAVSNSFALLHGAVKGIVFFLLNSVFLPKLHSPQIHSYRGVASPPLKCHSSSRASWNRSKGIAAVGREDDSGQEAKQQRRVAPGLQWATGRKSASWLSMATFVYYVLSSVSSRLIFLV